ncbi:HAD family hydrolase [Streptomyces sp. Ru72]|uniref:HAD family hydrolase n=1 Tax=Streptomyces sp. Ru72 TaxID=2080747 RepID=UPI000CDE4225|nr:HAD family hydrolase [Streptomyces sp. Ru72]POX44962.1 haloacid dehalogenase [Streptomyces sp. Ru72]
MASKALLGAISTAQSIFFDFDGPVCEVFAGIPASEVARSLVDVMREFDPKLSKEMEGMDFMDALRISPQAGLNALRAVEDRLIEAELAAVKVAGEPTPGVVASLEAARASGRAVAIVSNNSSQCVREFLTNHDLTSLVQEIVGRPAYEPHRMKPSPYSLLVSAARLGVAPERCTLVGDSVSDVEAAIAAEAMSIGYANRAGKEQSLARAGADAVIGSMDTLADALRESPVV